MSDAADLFLRADAAWWAGHIDDALAGYEVAYRAHLGDGDRPGAAMAALLLGAHAMESGDTALGSGWFQRARRILSETEEGPAHGYPLYWDMFAAMGRGDLDTAMSLAGRMQALGQQYGDSNLVAVGIMGEGRGRIKRGDVDAGLALLDEAMVMVLADELHPLWVGAIYCHLMDACHELQDLHRAATWTQATSRWCDEVGHAVVYRGICRVHRAQVFQAQGAWARAEAEAHRASRDLPRVHVGTTAEAHYQLGEIHRLRGDLDKAEASYRRAHQLGRNPQPGLALLRADRGDEAEACTSLRTALAEHVDEPLQRAPLSAALVDIAIAAGELESARGAAAELRETAAAFHSPGLHAAGRQAAGTLQLAEGDVEGALASLRAACSAWQELDVPYEAARCRQLLARGYQAMGDRAAATLELDAARATFEKLGAATELDRIDDVPQVAPDRPVPDGLSPRELEVLRLVATGQTNQEVARALNISDKTVARHVANIYLKIEVRTRSAATAYAYEHGLVSTDGTA